MRSRLLTLICGAVLLVGCAEEPVTAGDGQEQPQVSPPTPNPYLRILDIALGGWQQLTAENGESYRYVVNAGSVFGPSYGTTLTVQEGEVVQRDLAMTEIDDEGNTTVVKLWSETGSAVGSHEDYAAAPVTLDARYEGCKKAVESVDLDANEVYLEFIAATNAGSEAAAREDVLSECLVLPKDIAYDGGSEVVSNLEFLKND